ncbi:MAG: replicative DNA helicase, partial [Lachnospiraceae bacterium]|nr:replicative DNA helicase [Lachnospiraceae bacterium]
MADERDEIIKKEMPRHIESEQAVIAAMLMDHDAVVKAQELLTAEDFYSRQNQMVFQAIVELSDKNPEIDLVMLQNKLRDMGMPPETTGLEFLRSLSGDVYSAYHVERYCEIIAEKSLLRKMIRTNMEIANECYAGEDDTNTILEIAEKKIFDLVQKRNTGDVVPIRKIVSNVMTQIEKASKLGGTLTGIASGFYELDYKTAGFQKSDLIIIAARPSMGKTAFVLNLAEHACLKDNHTVAIFSLEMSKEQLVNRLLAMDAKVDNSKLKIGDLSDDEWTDLIESGGRLGMSHMIIDDTPAISVSELRSKCRKFKLEHDLDMIIIDYLQLMTGGKRSESKQQEISEISRSLKAVARELNVPVLALSQLSRSVEQRPDKR